MSVQVQIRRGNTSQHSSFTGLVGEVTADTEKKTLVLHDGSTAGGFPLITALAKQSIIPSTDNTFSLGNTTNRWSELYISGNTIVIGDQTITSNSTGVNISGSFFVDGTSIANSTVITLGANVVLNTSTLSIGNSTVNTTVNSSAVTTGNVVSNNISGNGASITSINANNISNGIISSDRFPSSGVTANTYGNSSQIPVFTVDATGRLTAANTVAVAGVSNVVYTEANTSLVISTGDGSSFTVNFGTANSSYNGFIRVVDSTTNTSANVAASANSVKTAVDASSTAYTNATAFAANADNISSGTLNTARLPSTANIATAINVGANVNLTADRITVGNSTVNSFITATGIETDGILSVANTATFLNGINLSNTVISNVAVPVNPQDAANKQYVDSVAEGLYVHEACEVATTDTLAIISGNTVTYDNGSSGVGATLTLNSAITVIDGHTLVSNDRILVRAETNTAHNGIYVYSNSTVFTRATDFDTALEIAGGDFTFVINGTTFAKTGHVKVAELNTVGTDPIIFEQFSGAGTFTAGDYLYLNGSEFNVNATSNSTASVVVARDSDSNFSANTVTLSSLVSGNAQFSGSVTGITTLDSGNTTITGFANVSQSVFVGNSTSNVAISGGSVSVSGYNQSFVTHTSSNTDLQAWDSFSSSTYRSTQYFVQLVSGVSYHTINLLLTHDATTVWLVQFGEVFTGSSLGTFSAAISGGNVVVSVTPANATTTIKAVRTAITV